MTIHAPRAETAHEKSPDDDADTTNTPYTQPFYRYYVLAVLTVVYVFNFVDRQLLVILQEPIKAELNLSDTQLGLLTGFAFALFYVICGIPIARWADKGNRRTIIALALTIWSVMTAMCGLAANYTHLLLARVGVGVGEAGGSPPAHSMISDIFKPKNRALALSVYSIGIYIGILIGFAAGGFLADAFSWRLAFFVVGIPGVALALLVLLTVREPIRGWSEGDTKAVEPAPPIGDVARLLWSRISFRHIALAASMQAFIIYGIGNWLPSYFLRTYELDIGTIGAWMALTTGFGGGLGSFCGGWMADKFGAKDVRWYLWVPAILTSLLVPVQLAILLSGEVYFALIMTAPFHFLSAAYLGAVLAVSHNLVNGRMRAMTSAVLFFVLNLIGLGLGPVIVGFLSDVFTRNGMVAPLGTAMLICGTVAAIWSVTHYILAANKVREDIARRQV
ncbi:MULTISPECIES: spinster family MFS transporter [unclassified Hyphomonas]|jgi:MFS family permease|uniref:spinster family MFS transporter n=2 Tax=Hyphomonas TaxID=85 RepID=UPI000C55AE59|nr:MULTISPECIES: MFS transporter [unclassified Hyphomonas]MAA83910.1 MFS transporter [Hyphomonas sp.]MAL48077.1 MFS transporter [Hyphomonas sp.]MAX84499.1 MFS transporter [Hyphomonas sp.]MAX85225.1 MFS transporter [Hyphomonas sp.]MBO6583374.1 MFS transporter [Hyphomonas sp.]|tara:strand:- start:14684 stop:16027 length:1344 start_codon:yes stop_codon:yes gene_type:complete